MLLALLFKFNCCSLLLHIAAALRMSFQTPHGRKCRVVGCCGPGEPKPRDPAVSAVLLHMCWLRRTAALASLCSSATWQLLLLLQARHLRLLSAEGVESAPSASHCHWNSSSSAFCDYCCCCRSAAAAAASLLLLSVCCCPSAAAAAPVAYQLLLVEESQQQHAREVKGRCSSKIKRTIEAHVQRASSSSCFQQVDEKGASRQYRRSYQRALL